MLFLVFHTLIKDDPCCNLIHDAISVSNVASVDLTSYIPDAVSTRGCGFWTV